MNNTTPLRAILFILLIIAFTSTGAALLIKNKNFLDTGPKAPAQVAVTPTAPVVDTTDVKNVASDSGSTGVNPLVPVPPSTAGTAGTIPTPTPAPAKVAVLGMSDVAKHAKESSCWIVLSNKIYDVTSFLGTHPGGKQSIIDVCGTDATKAYASKGANPPRPHSAFANNLLPTYYIGEIGKSVAGTSASKTTVAKAPLNLPPGTKAAIPTQPVQVVSTLPKAVPGSTPTSSSTNPYNLAAVATHKTQGDCWLIISGSIYDVSSFMTQHPGGASSIVPFCGTESTTAFNTKGGRGRDHTAFAYSMLPTYFIAKLSTATVDPTKASETIPPVVKILSPVNNASFPAGQSITITADATDASGINYVQFIVDGSPIGTDTSAPYSMAWTSQQGSHTITARAVDANIVGGNVGLASITVVVTGTVVQPIDSTSLTATAIATHNSSGSCWLIINNKVYDVTNFLNSHPGGAASITPFCGKESTSAFNTKGSIGSPHSSYASSLLPTYYLGDVGATVNPTPPPVAPPPPPPPPAPNPVPAGTIYTAAQTATHSTQADCWLIISGKIYNVSPYINSHPGGATVIVTNCGKDVTTLFTQNVTGGHAHSNYAFSLLPSYYVGDLGTAASDTTAPTVTITAPTGGTVSGSVNILATASDNVGVVGVQFQVDGTNLGAEDTASPYSATWATTGGANGPHTLTAIARDASGNTKSTTVTVSTNNAVVDTTPPSVPTGLAATAASSSQINLSWTISTDNVAVTGYKIYRAGTQIGTSVTTTYQDKGLTASTAYSYTVAANDAAGNTSAQSTAASATTLTPPVVTYTAAQVATHSTQTDCWLIISNKVYNVTTFLASHPGGIPSILAYCGKESTVGFQTKGVTGGSNHSTFAYSLLPTYYVGDLGATASDTTAPTVSITAPTTGSTVSGTVTITATASDNVGVVGVQFKVDGANSGAEDTTSPYSISWATTGITNGSHALTAVARDAAGNTKTSTTVTVTTNNAVVDTTAPSVPTGLTATAASSSQINLAWTASTDNVAVTGYKIYRAGTQIGTSVTTTYQDKGLTASTAYSYTVAANDAAGNTSAQSTAASATTQAPPLVTYTATQVAPHSLQTDCWLIISNKVYNVTAFLSQHPGGIPSILTYCGKESTTAFKTKGVTGGSDHSTFAYSLLPTYYIGDLLVVVDTTAPTVSITAPTTGTTVSGTISVTATASDNIGVVGVQFKLDGANLSAEVMTAPYTISWGTTGSSNGSHALTAVARDAAGNTKTSTTVTVTTNNTVVDTTPPSVPTGLAATAASASQINLTWTASTDNVAVTGYKVYRAGTQIGTPTTNSYSDSGLSASTAYSYTVAAVDAAGNTSAQSTAASATTPAATVMTYNAAQVAAHATQGDCWLIISGKVYNVTAFMGQHPGGNPVIVAYCGKDSTTVFTQNVTGGHAHSTFAYSLLPTYYVGDFTATNDTTAPTVSITAPTAGTTVSGTVTVSATASDNVGVIGVQFKVDGTNIGVESTAAPYSVSWGTTGLANGSHSLTAVARDAAGNTKTSTAVSVTTNNASIDATPPSTPTGLTATAATTTVINLSWTASTDNVGVTGYKVYRAGTQVGSPTGTTYSDTGLNPGTSYSYTVAAVDAAGNTSAQSTAASATTLSAVTTFTTAQLITHSASSDCWLAIMGKVYNVTSYINSHPGGRTAITSRCGSNSTLAFTSNANGGHSHSATAYNLLPTYYVGDYVETTDATPPTVSITSPASGASVTGTVTISATASDNVGVIGVQFYLDGNTKIGSEDLTAPYSVNWNTSGVSTTTTHTLTAVARDAAPNKTTSSGVSVTVH